MYPLHASSTCSACTLTNASVLLGNRMAACMQVPEMTDMITGKQNTTLRCKQTREDGCVVE